MLQYTWNQTEGISKNMISEKYGRKMDLNIKT